LPSSPSAKSRFLATPTPLSPRKAQAQTEIPTQRASQLALELLLTLGATTHPAHLTAGLNSYARPACDVSDFGPIMTTGKIDNFKSPLAGESVQIGKARDCWTMVRNGFLSPKDGASTAQAKRIENDDNDLSDGDDRPDCYVASHAWRVVEWWIKLFEMDQVVNTAESATGTCIGSHLRPLFHFLHSFTLSTSALTHTTCTTIRCPTERYPKCCRCCVLRFDIQPRVMRNKQTRFTAVDTGKCAFSRVCHS
jgi:hypothetical protein